MVNSFKTVSSKLVRKNHTEYLKKFYWKPVFWSSSYCILNTGEMSIETIKKYIEMQGKEEELKLNSSI